MSFLRNRVGSLIKRDGKTITHRRMTFSAGPNPAPNPPTTGVLAIVGTPAQGDTTITLDAAIVSGRLVAGDKLRIAGQPRLYTVTNEVVAASNVFTGVQITPGLSAAPANDTVVNCTFAADTELQAKIAGFPRHRIDGSNILATDLSVIIAGVALETPPRIGDFLLIDTTQMRVLNVTPAFDGDAVGLWNIHARL